MHSVLGHFQTRGSYTTCIDGLTWSEEHLLCYEVLSSLGSTAHVRGFCYDRDPISMEHLSVGFVHFVLGCTGHSDVYLLFPWLLACEELSLGELLDIVRDDVVTARAELKHSLELFFGIDPIGVVDIAVRARDGDDLSS